MRKIHLFILLLLCSCNSSTIEKKYYDTGELYTEISLNKNGERDGFTYVYYKNGSIKDKAHYSNGKITDTVYGYNEDGKINNIEYYSIDSSYNILYKNGIKYKTGAFLKSNPKFGWIKVFRKGRLESKSELVDIYNKKFHVNSYVFYNENGDTVKDKSFFYKLKIPDTVVLNQYFLGEICFNSDKASVNRLKDQSLIILASEDITKNYDNISKIPLDSFDDKNKFAFKFTRSGNQVLRGKFIEKVMTTKDNKENSELMDVELFDRDFYFEKEVYVKKKGNVQ